MEIQIRPDTTRISDSDPPDLVARCVGSLRTSSHAYRAHSPSHYRNLYKRITPSHKEEKTSDSPISSDTLIPDREK